MADTNDDINEEGTGTAVLTWTGLFHTETDARIAISASFAPFDNGDWYITWNATTKNLVLEWLNVLYPVWLRSLEWYVGKSKSAPGLRTGKSIKSWPRERETFPAQPSGSLEESLRFVSSGTFAVILSLDPRPGNSQGVSDACHQKWATVRRSSAMRILSVLTSNDVVLYFPHTQRELWANTKTLSKASPYFKTMFESAFEEGGNGVSQLAQSAAAVGSDASWCDDSDDEADEVQVAFATVREGEGSPLPAGTRQVTITQAAYTTYHAVLSWILIGHIEFAPIRLASAAATPSSSPARPAKRARLDEPARPPGLPLPASPKAVYQLAHLLEKPDLMRIALDNFKSQLTADNVLWQLMEAVAVHDEVKDVITAFAKANWTEVKASKAATELCKVEVLQSMGCGLEAMARMMELMRKC